MHKTVKNHAKVAKFFNENIRISSKILKFQGKPLEKWLKILTSFILFLIFDPSLIRCGDACQN